MPRGVWRQRTACGSCCSPPPQPPPHPVWDPSESSGLASSILLFETTCEPLLPLSAGSLVHIPRPPKLPTLPANTCRCVSFFNQHLNGHFLLPVAHHRGRCCQTVLEVKSLVCVSWDSTSGHSSKLMCLSLSTIPHPRWSLVVPAVTYSASMEEAHFSPPAISFQCLLQLGCFSELRSLPYLNPSWIPLCSYKHDPSPFCSLSLMLGPTLLPSPREQEHLGRHLCFGHTEVIPVPSSPAHPRSFASAASAFFLLLCLVSSSLARASPG